MSANRKDREALRALADQVAEIAALPVQRATIAAWQALNGLKPVRPMVMIDQIPWHEMDIDGELALTTDDPFCRAVETRLRRLLYRWRHLRGDMVVEPVLEFPKVIRGLDFGMRKVEELAVADPQNDVVSHRYIDQLPTEEDVEKIQMPDVVLDEAETARIEERAHALFDGILAVKMQGDFPRFAAWDRITEWRGAERVLWDLIDRPEHMHQIVDRLLEAQLAMLDQLEEQGLLGSAQSTVHCTGAHTDALPAPGADPARPQAKDLWTYGMAQIFSEVSPAMHREFEIDYAARWYQRFGLGYYGCCEPLHDKIDLIRQIPNVRKISMSPWVDIKKGAERIGGDFVFSRKPNPAFLAGDFWEPEAVARDLGDTVAQCKRNGCPLELILKDISTVGYRPQRLWAWADIAMEAVGAGSGVAV
ncbi:MAG: hypothetical protein QGH25_03435 [Candidatus Latescibacteria bacterium]|nr:hypothetical protein [Candidatus Latescibacterota bacterium]